MRLMRRELQQFLVLFAFLLPLLAASPGGAGDAQGEPETLTQALRQGKMSVKLNYRFESVADDNPRFAGREGLASTLRFTLGYASAPFKGASAFVQFERVADLGLADRHNNAGAGSLANGATDYPVVADPELTSVHQAYLKLEFIPKTTILAGRQEILLGDVRFIGNVGWRQHHQGFDALRLTNTSLAHTTLTYAYVVNQRRIFGDTRPLDSHLFNVEFDVRNTGRLTLYSYLLDYENAAHAGASSATHGARFAGSRGDETFAFLYDMAYALQRDFGDNPATIDAGYYKAELGLRKSKVTFKAGYEVLEGSPGSGSFSTPLATLHKFAGWADKFLVTPPNGLADAYISLAAKLGSVKLLAVYHDFRAQTGSEEYGTEIDLQALYSSPWKLDFGAKAAFYDAKTHSTGTDKLWVWAAYDF